MIEYIGRYNDVKSRILKSKFDSKQVEELFSLIDNYSDMPPLLLGYTSFEKKFNDSLEEIVDHYIRNCEESILLWIKLLIDKISYKFFNKDYNKDKDCNAIPQKSIGILFKTIIYSEKYVLKSKIPDYNAPMFVYIFLLVSTIKKIKNIDLLEESLKNINMSATSATNADCRADKEIFIKWFTMRLLINSYNIKWKDKKHLFWDWCNNPYLRNFFDIKNFNSFESIYRNELIENIDLLNIYNFIDLLNAIKEDLKNDANERKKFEEQVFKELIIQLKKAADVIYKMLNHYDNEGYIATEDIFVLFDSYKYFIFFGNADYLNKIVKDIIHMPIDNRKKQDMEEYFHLYFFLKNLREKEKYEIIKIKKTESPDFVLKAHNGEEIGLELISMEQEDEHKPENRIASLDRVMYVDPYLNDFKKQIEDKISKKLEKCEAYKKNIGVSNKKLWLYIHPSVLGETSIKNMLFQQDTHKSILRELNQKHNNCFDEIYLDKQKLYN